MVLFCQMDVTGRTERDPAAERLARNLLNYASDLEAAAAGAPSFTPAIRPDRSIFRAPATRSNLTPAGALKPERVLVVGPGAGATLASDKAAIAAWLKQDGHVLALGLDAGETDKFLPSQIETKQAEHIGSYFDPPAGELTAGRRRTGRRPQPRSAERSRWSRAALRPWATACSPSPRAATSSSASLPPWQFNIQQQNTKRTFRRTSSLLFPTAGQSGRARPDPAAGAFLEAGQADRWPVRRKALA